MDYTPDYIDTLQSNQIFVFGSNTLGYHTGGASRTARKKFGAVWGQPEGLQGQSYAIPVDFGKGVRKDTEVKAAVDRFIAFAEAHPELFFLVTRVGCGIAGYHDEEMAQFFKEAKHLKNVYLPKSFIDVLNAGKVSYDLNRFMKAQESEYESYQKALNEIKSGRKVGRWIWYVFPQIKGLGHSFNSEFYGISGEEEARDYLNHPILGKRLREISQALLDVNSHSAYSILGRPDDIKVQSCMTLFDLISPKDVFAQVLHKYYDDRKCPKTDMRIGIRHSKPILKKLTICKDFCILLGNVEVKMEPLVKSVYLLFLRHPEGIVFKDLPDYRKELTTIYSNQKPISSNDRILQSIEDVTNPLLNSINEKCSRIKAIFANLVEEALVGNYIISGKSGEAKKIILPRNLIIWENDTQVSENKGWN